jgi:lipopolysaccharide/colanic/teichoic acid biosynthesis glycosyltransferase
LTKQKQYTKRWFDFSGSIFLIVCLSWFLLLLILLATIDTKRIGVFSQKRIGHLGREFLIFKIRTMEDDTAITTHVTTTNDSRLTIFGKLLRKYKLDELPQLFNVLFGQMSFVGPRPDVKGFADELIGEDRIILTVKPGITGPASLKFKNEEVLLALQDYPEEYNRKVIWPQKVAVNKQYVENYSFKQDIVILIKTLF